MALYTFCKIATPGALQSFIILNVVEGSWSEELEFRGVEEPAWDGTMLSTLRDSRHICKGTVEFLTTPEYDQFRDFIGMRIDPTTGRRLDSWPMMMVSDAAGVLRGQQPRQVRITLGRAVAHDYGSQQTWTVDMTFREL